MVALFIIVFILLGGVSGFCIYSVYKLNLYIEKLEDTVKENIELTQNLMQSMKEVIAEDYLQNDGRLKKFIVQKETRNIIYNGMGGDSEIVEI